MKIFFSNITDFSDFELERWYSEMSSERQQKCRRIKNELAQKSCIAADRLVRFAAAERFLLPPEEIKINTTPEGKPFLVGSSLEIGLSHSHILIVCAISEKPVGIDLEFRRPISDKVQLRICDEEERNYLLEADESVRIERFFELWTRKEALYKLDNSISGNLTEIPALHPERVGATVKTSQLRGYTLSIAEKKE